LRATIHNRLKLLSEAFFVYGTNPNVQAFLGSAYATEYFLSGEADKESLQKALTEFDNVKKLDSNYRLDSRYFSPRILELFAQESEKLTAFVRLLTKYQSQFSPLLQSPKLHVKLVLFRLTWLALRLRQNPACRFHS